MTMTDAGTSQAPDGRLAAATETENRWLADIARNLGDAVVVHTLDGSICSWNKGAEKLFGYAPAAALGLAVHSLFAAASHQAYAAYIAQLLAEGPNRSLELLGATREGRHPDLLLHASLLLDQYGQATAVAAVIRDISLQKGVETKLMALIESTPDPFIIVEADGSIQRVNRQAEILFGYDRQQLIGKSFKILVPERFRPQHDIYTRNYQVTPIMRQMGSGLELWCLTSSGEEIPVEIGLSPVVAQDETTIMVRFHDIRAQKREKAILQQALQRADEANRTKSRFLAAASHDLRQPLQSISMNLGVLTSEAATASRERATAQMRMALDTTNNLLNSLLNITRLESGKVQPAIEDFRIAKVLERVYNIESRPAQEKQHRFSLCSSSLAVTSDPALLEQSLTNLVANAIRYTPPGGHILLGCRRHGSHLRIDVIDNGPGIAPEALDYIFDEYRQLEQSRHYQGMGLGLGLSIVKLLAELLHLKLEVRSTPGKGSCFSVLVPLASAAFLSERTEETPAPQDTITGTVLLIDDDEAVLDSTTLFLETFGFRVLQARNPAEALSALTDAVPDVIVTDYGLAKQETGIDLLERIRKHLQQDIPAIVITGDASLQRSQAESMPKLAIIYKPVDPQTLLQRVRKLLRQELAQRS